MTLPSIENLMPYGVVWKPREGSQYFVAEKTPSRVNGVYLSIDPGAIQVTFTWTGAEECRLGLRRAGQLTTLASIPAMSGGVRSPKTIRFGALTGDELYLSLYPVHAATTANPTATIEVIPTSS